MVFSGSILQCANIAGVENSAVATNTSEKECVTEDNRGAVMVSRAEDDIRESSARVLPTKQAWIHLRNNSQAKHGSTHL